MKMWNISAENLVHGKKIYSVWLGVILLVFTMYVLMRRKNRKLPPGPIGLPIFGYYFALRKKPIESLNELAKKYGNVVGFYVGPKYLVCANDWKSVKDVLGQDAILGRPNSLLQKYPYKFGFSGTNGEVWAETRHIVSKIMKDNLQRNRWEELQQLESSDIVELIAKEAENPIEIRTFLGDTFSRMVSLLFGNQPKTEHSTAKMLTKSVEFMEESLTILQMNNFSITLALFLWMLGLEKIPPIIEKTRDLVTFVSDAVDSNKHKLKSNVPDSFISRFNEEIENCKTVKEITFNSEDILKGSVLSLMMAGNGTSKATLIWALIAMADHPNKQNKVHEELDRVIGQDGTIRWSERSLIPYTMATLLETMRWKTVIYLNMRETTQDTQIQGYHIPKGSYVMTNFFLVQTDSSYWKDPEQFLPERFLSEEESRVNMAPESFCPFSHGKRNCPGKLLAQMHFLQNFTAIMQNFKVVPKEGDKVKYEEAFGITYRARNAELRFIKRQNKFSFS